MFSYFCCLCVSHCSGKLESHGSGNMSHELWLPTEYFFLFQLHIEPAYALHEIAKKSSAPAPCEKVL